MRAGPISKTVLESRLESWCIAKDATDDEDIEFHEARLACCALEDTAVNLEALFKNEIIRFTQYAQTAHSTAKLFRAFYEEGENQSRMTVPSRQLESVRHRLVESNVHKIADAIDAGIIAPLKRLFTALTPVKAEVRERCDAKARHDHYRAKLAALRAENEKILAKGKPLSRSEVERLIRNEGKYERCRLVYIALNKRAIIMLKHLYDTRFEYLDQVFSSYADLQRLMWENLSRDSSAWKDSLIAAASQPVREAGPMPTLPAIPDANFVANVPPTTSGATLPESVTPVPVGSGEVRARFEHLDDDDYDAFSAGDRVGSSSSATQPRSPLRSNVPSTIASQGNFDDPEDPFDGE